MKNHRNKSAAGFSIVELLMVIVLIAILSSIAFMSFSSTKLYDADRQALQITDLLQEARQRSLSQRNTLRVEINSTKNSVRLIDEIKSGDASDDVVLKTSFFLNEGVYVGTTPSNLSAGPTESSPVLPISYNTSTHPLSTSDQVAVIRFRKGNAQNAGTDAIGTNSIPTGATVYVWSKHPTDNSTNPTVGNIIRAITVIGSSGSTRLWKCEIDAGDCSQWKY